MPDIVVGIDPHKTSHTAVAVRAATGAQVAQLRVPESPAGHARLRSWAAALGGSVRFAVEDVRHVSGRLEASLVDAGGVVVRVPPKLMAGQRRSARSYGKSDPIDALAVARAALREPELALAGPVDQAARAIDLLLAHHDDLVAERTRAQNRLRWHLHSLGLDDVPPGGLDRGCWLERLGRRLGRVERTVEVAIARELVATIRRQTTRIRALATELDARTAAAAPALRAIVGCGPLTAAKIIAETGAARSVRSERALALMAGVAPLDVSSGRHQRHRLNRSGNRQLNLALHRIAITQGQHHPPARSYLERRQREGKTRLGALRCLKRHLARTVYHALTTSPNSDRSEAPTAAQRRSPAATQRPLPPTTSPALSTPGLT